MFLLLNLAVYGDVLVEWMYSSKLS